MPIWLPLYRIEKFLDNCKYMFREAGTNYPQCVHLIRLRPVTPQCRADDLTVIDFENFQLDPSSGHFRGEPTLYDGNIPSLLEPPTTGVKTRIVTEDLPPVTLSFLFPIAPAPIAVGPAAAPVPLDPPAVPAAPAFVAPAAADVEMAEAQLPERPQLPTQDARISDKSDDSLPNDSTIFA